MPLRGESHRGLANVTRIAIGILLFAAAITSLLWASGRGFFGDTIRAGTPRSPAHPPEIIADRERRQAEATEEHRTTRQILFGDLHVHSSFSLDAFQLALPMSGGEGVHPVADACDFARHCAELDFWSINDHANSLTPRRWRETIEAIRACDATGSEGEDPDLVPFLGWEWTQMGSTPENHWGHKNVLLRDLEPEAIPTRPISAAPPPGVPSPFDAARGGTLALGLGAWLLEGGHDLAAFLTELASTPACPAGQPVRSLPEDCRESAATPAELFDRLRDWDVPVQVLPHGTTWGMYTPPGANWRKQLDPGQHDPDLQRVIEIYSGHGNAEEYRDWSGVEIDDDGLRRCPPARVDYLPACQRAGEIIEERCLAEGENTEICDDRAARARQAFVDADRNAGPWTVPGVLPDQWLDAGQCRDCFQPAFNYRPASSVQAILALEAPEHLAGSERFRFGFIGSSDNHTARAGTGYKEVERREFTDARMGEVGRSPITLNHRRSVAPRAERFENRPDVPSVAFFEAERGASFYLTGGLAAVHAACRSREAIWEALERREVYATSGPRILLWFDLVDTDGSHPMGSVVTRESTPRFRVRAVGSFEQKPGCPERSANALGTAEIERLCRGECYYPSDVRRPITRIEVVRIRPGQSSLAESVEDPWLVLPCSGDSSGCVAEFEDPEYARNGQDSLYYVRAIENPAPTVDADPLGCAGSPEGDCPTPAPCFERPDDDDCLFPSEARAWSSPIFLEFGRTATAPPRS
jgi:hypothetical protein